MSLPIDHELESERTEREQAEQAYADRMQDQWPGRWAEWASPARIRRDIQREREEERYASE